MASKNVFVFVEQRNGVIQPVGRELLGKARELADKLGETVGVILLGSGVEGLAAECIAHGADVVYTVDSAELKHYLTEPYAQAITQVVKTYEPSILLLGATTIGRDLGPRLSARLTTGLTADCTGLEIGEDRNLQMTRPAFGGNLMATIVCKEHRPQMSTVRPGVMTALKPDTSRKGTVERVSITFDTSKFRVKLLEAVAQERTCADITEAKILISAGRGAISSLPQLPQLAHLLDAEVSASRAVVDSGALEHQRQVGQTGKTVRPEVYFALGISGAIQHLAGMEESETIIAVNRDKFAPIFQVADLGIVGDVSKIVPLLIEKLKK